MGLIMNNEELNNKLFGNSSISIILKQFKEEHISESEAIQLIEDLFYSKNNNFVPVFPQWPQITYTEPKYQKWEVTCVDK